MKKSTINRIRDAAQIGRTVIIGRYTYRANLYTGEISRCKTDDVGREWLTWDGQRITRWEVIGHL